MKKLFYILLIFSISLFANDPRILKIEDRVTNELVERSKEYFKEYKEWQIKEHNKWLKGEIEWKKLGNQDYSRVSPKFNPDITYEEYREKGYLGNWLATQVDLEDTIWGKLVKVPENSRLCGNATPVYAGGISGKGLWDLKSRLMAIGSSRKYLPDELISKLELEYINTACTIDMLLLSDKKKLKYAVEKMRKINAGLDNKTTDYSDLIKGLVMAFFMFIFLWFVAFGSKGFDFSKKEEKKEDNIDYSLFNYMMYKWWFK